MTALDRQPVREIARKIVARYARVGDPLLVGGTVSMWEGEITAALLRGLPQWQPIATAPKMTTILLFAVTDIDAAGIVKNWKMDTGFWNAGAECWSWEGRQLRNYDIQPTHWQPLPEPPAQGIVTDGAVRDDRQHEEGPATPRQIIERTLLDVWRDLGTLKWIGSDEGWDNAIRSVRDYLHDRMHGIERKTVAAQGIVTEGQDPQGLGEAEGRVEPGPKDAPEISVIPGERDEAMRRQEATEAMIRMREPRGTGALFDKALLASVKVIEDPEITRLRAENERLAAHISAREDARIECEDAYEARLTAERGRAEAADERITELEGERDTATLALGDIVGMIAGCPDAPRNPDSLPQMVLFTARAALSNTEKK